MCYEGRSLCGPSRQRMWVTNVPEIHPKDKRIKLKAGFEKNKTKKPTPSFIGMHASIHLSGSLRVCLMGRARAGNVQYREMMSEIKTEIVLYIEIIKKERNMPSVTKMTRLYCKPEWPSASTTEQLNKCKAL